MYALLEILHEKIRNNALYYLATNWSALNKVQVPEMDDPLPTVFATLPYPTFRELGIERPKAPAQKWSLWRTHCVCRIGVLSTLHSGLLNLSQGDGEKGYKLLTAAQRVPSFWTKGNRRIEASCVRRPSSDVKEKDVLEDIVPAASTILLDTVKEAMVIVLTNMKSGCVVYNVNFWDLLDSHGDVAGNLLRQRQASFLPILRIVWETSAVRTALRMKP